LDVQHRVITPYFNSVINITGDVCKFVNGTDRNPAFKWFLNMIGESLPKGFIHACPYYREVFAYNVSLEMSPEMTVFLMGRYKIAGRLFDNIDDNIFTFILEFDLFPDRPNRANKAGR